MRTGGGPAIPRSAFNGVDDDENGYVDDCRGYDFSSDDGRDNDPRDQNGHGTVVAGIAAAATNNLNPTQPGAYEGVAGMARQASIMALRALDAYGGGYSLDIAEAIDYAAANGARVINLSLTFPPQTPGSSPDMLALQRAISDAQAAGVLIVAAAGNENYNGIDYPAKFAGVLAVGASNQSDQRASFSNYGARLDMLAPGTGIFSTLMGPGNQSYGLFEGVGSGTSFAAPHVAGAGLLVRSLRPDLGQAEVRELLLRTADDLAPAGFDPQTGWGRLNVQGALAEAAQGLSLTLSVDPPAVAAGAETTLRVQVQGPAGAPAGFGGLVTLGTTAGSVAPVTVTVDDTGQAEATYTAPDAAGGATVTAALGGVSASLPLAVSSGVPASLQARADPAVVPAGGQSKITAEVLDDAGNRVRDGIDVSFAAALGAVQPQHAATSRGAAEAVFTAGQTPGQGSVQASVGAIQAAAPVIIVGPGQPFSMTLTASPIAGQIDGAPVTLTASVWDGAGAPVPDGALVRFSTDLGKVTPLEAVTAGGKATAQLQPGSTVGVAHVSATSGYAEGQIDVQIVASAAATVTLAASPAELTAGYNQIATLTVTAADRYGNPIADGSVIQLTTTLGKLASTAAPTTGGQAVVELVGGLAAGNAVVTAKAPGGAGASTTVLIRPGSAGQLTLEAAPAEIVMGGDASRVKATVRDVYGNAVAAGTVVTFTTDLGTLRAVGGAPAQGPTLPVGTAQGLAQVDLLSGQIPGTAHVRAEAAGAPPQIVPVQIKEGAPAKITLTLKPLVVRRGGRLEIVANVVDKNGNPVADGTVVSFAANRGTLDRTSAATSAGLAYTWLTAPVTAGPIQIVALSGPASAFGSASVAVAERFLPLIMR